MKKVAIIMGSDSDLPIVEKGINVLKEYNVPFEVHVIQHTEHQFKLQIL